MSNPSSRPKKTQSQRRAQARPERRQPGAVRRPVSPPDYSKDYADVRRDLIRIGIYTVVLFAGMVGISFFV